MSKLGDTGKLRMPTQNKRTEKKQDNQETSEKVLSEVGSESKKENQEVKEVKPNSMRKAMDFGQQSNSKPYELDLTKPKQKENEGNEEKVQGDEKQESEEVEKDVQVNEQEEEEQSSQEDSVLEVISEETDKSDSEKGVTKEAESKETTQATNEKEVEEIAKEQGLDLPENLQKVVEFMNDTHGSLEDYVRLNADYSNVSEQQLLKEYYKQTQSHLDDDDISFKIEELSYDEEIDDEREVRRKKLQFKEEVSKARQHLEGLKDKYYNEVKLSSKLSPEQREAVEFYNSHKEQSKTAKESRQDFAQKTEQLFNEEFKGFEYQVGDKKYRYKVNDVEKIKKTQSDYNNVIGGFFDEQSGKLNNALGYHRSVFASIDPDSFAEHFYNQGRAEAIKETEANAKNINMDARKDHGSNIKVKGVTVKPVRGTNSTKLKFNKNIKGRR